MPALLACMELTLLEIHLDDASFAANAPFAGRSSSEGEESSDGGSTAAADERDLHRLLPFLVGLGALAGIAYLVRRWRRGGDAGTQIEPEVAEPEAPTP